MMQRDSTAFLHLAARALVAGDTLEQQVQSPVLERGQRQVVDDFVMPEDMEVDIDSCQPALG